MENKRRSRGILVISFGMIGLGCVFLLAEPFGNEELQPQLLPKNVSEIQTFVQTHSTQNATREVVQRITSREADLVTARRYLEQAQFPPDSKPLNRVEEDPVPQGYRAYPIQSTGEPRLRAWVDKVDFVYPERIGFYAEEVSSKNSRGRLTANELELILFKSGQESSVAKVILVRNDRLASNDQAARNDWAASNDQAACNDRTSRYEGQLDPRELAPGLSGEEISGAYTAIVKGYDLALGFNISEPQVKLTEKFRDRVEKGSLLIEVQLQVEKKGRFHLEGSLYTQEGDPLAWAEDALELSPGAHWLGLRFYGKIFKNKGVDGPYLLKHLSLSRTGVMPNMKSGLLSVAYQTQPYKADQFTSEPYRDPELIRAAQRLVGPEDSGY